MSTFRNHSTVKAVVLLLSVMLPCGYVLFMMGVLETGIFNMLWCGFYGVVLTLVCTFPWWVKLVVAAINLLPFCMLGLGFLMGGWSGLLWLLGKAVLPFAF